MKLPMKTVRNKLLLRISLLIAVCVITLSGTVNLIQYGVVKARFDNSFAEAQSAVGALKEKASELAELTAQENAARVVDILAEIAPTAIAAFDLSGLDQYANTATQNEDIAIVEYLTADGETLASAQAREPAQRDDARIVRDIVSDGNKLGSVSVALTFNSLTRVQNAIDEVTGARISALEQGLDQTISSLIQGFVYSAIGFAVLLFAATYLLQRRLVFTPLGSLQNSMGSLAKGDLDSDVPQTSRRDEIGEMAAAVQVFKDNAIEKVRLESEHEENQRHAEKEKRQVMLTMADDFESSVGRVVDQVSSASTEMRASSEAMSVTAADATRQTSAVATASEQASANVQTVATAAEELSSSISEISRQVAQASQIASGAVQQAEQTNVKVQGLADAAQKIGEVVALITDIADQTNLLALNATIEAARAGDAGKGFAVVASEVKNLANQTAKATEEIGKTIAEIDQVNSGIASAVEEQGAATQEIARNVEQAAAGTQEVSSNIGGVSQAANDTGTAASQIQSAAGELSKQSETLRAEVDKFLANVREA